MEGLNIMTEEYRNIFSHILPEIKKYFTYTESAQNLITEINSKLENGYYRFMAWLPFTLSSAFLHSATGEKNVLKRFYYQYKLKKIIKTLKKSY